MRDQYKAYSEKLEVEYKTEASEFKSVIKKQMMEFHITQERFIK